LALYTVAAEMAGYQIAALRRRRFQTTVIGTDMMHQDIVTEYCRDLYSSADSFKPDDLSGKPKGR